MSQQVKGLEHIKITDVDENVNEIKTHEGTVDEGGAKSLRTKLNQVFASYCQSEIEKFRNECLDAKCFIHNSKEVV